ncbi:glycosyltransferase, group 1 family protein [Collinsella stercoris DSM 13279]|uniref:Glycosyltransferase, group 1 family protein n=1 Tax=Collinsella stercoris DSM 13279 TaxID=445975 RepID=B6GCE1_9ACTN|nr:glycosyltransferase, group 1 family protein [Collinsella stercoris DSM 13279]
MGIRNHNNPIVIVSDFGYIEGGAVAVAVKTALLLASEGRKVVFFCGEGPVCEDLALSDVETVCLDMPSINSNPSRLDAIRNGIWNSHAYESFLGLLKRGDLKDAIVHVHTWTKVLSSAVFAAATENGNPILLTVHDYFSVCPNGGFYDYNEKRICERKPMSGSCICLNCDKRSYAQKLWRVARQARQDRWVRNNPKLHYAFVSEYSRDILVPFLNSEYPYEVLRNPIDHLKRGDDRHEHDAFLFIGRVSPEKGADLFCEAVTAIGAKGIVIGDGEMLAELQARYPQIEFTGWVKPEQMRLHGINRAIAMVQPSRLHETALLTPLQMLEQGVPCIVPDRCAARDYVEEGVNGLLFKTGDVEDLERAMQEMLDRQLSPVPIRIDDEEYLRNLINLYKRVN